MILANIVWMRSDALDNRVLLVCIDGRCQSAKINVVRPLSEEEFEVTMELIDPSYFTSLTEGQHLTLQEASTVLARGIVRTID